MLGIGTDTTRQQPVHDHFPPDVEETLGSYVYLLRDPQDGEVFYVGKGSGERVFQHARAALKPIQGMDLKLARIQQILHGGRKVVTEILRYGMSEETAHEVEAAVIQAIGLPNLLNLIEGHGSLERGRGSTDEIITRLAAEPVEVAIPAILIRPSRLYSPDAPPEELYEVTRKWWRVGSQRDKAVYAMAVINGVVREVWRISGWYARAEGDPGWEEDEPGKPRWAFHGEVAHDQAHFKGRSVAHYWKPGAQSPFVYAGL